MKYRLRPKLKTVSTIGNIPKDQVWRENYTNDDFVPYDSLLLRLIRKQIEIFFINTVELLRTKYFKSEPASTNWLVVDTNITALFTSFFLYKFVIS